MHPSSSSRLIAAGICAVLFACAPKPPVEKIRTQGETFEQVLDGYAKLYDRQMTSLAGNEVDDLASECYAARDQIRQYDLLEYPQVNAANELEANLVLPHSLSQGLGIVAKVAGKSVSGYQVRLESPVALFLPQSEVDKLWAKPACASKVRRKNTTVALVRGYVFARLTAVVNSETAIAPKVKVFEEDVVSVRYLDNGTWQITDRAAKPYMLLASTQSFGEEGGAITRGEAPAPPALVRPTDQDVQALLRTTGRYGGEQ
jgi:hypothetical protein